MFLSSLTLTHKVVVVAYPSEAYLELHANDRLLGLLTKIRLDFKCFPATNTLAYFGLELERKTKNSFLLFHPDRKRGKCPQQK